MIYYETFEQPAWAKDEPSYLRTVADRLVDLKEKCPECGRQTLAGTYESDTNAISEVHCINPDCDYEE